MDDLKHMAGSLEEPLSAPQGRVFNVPVDSECKSKVLWPIYSFAMPHMRAFHFAWMCFFITFFATFAPAALLPIIRDNIGLTKPQATNAGVAAVCGAIGGRIAMGTLLDTVGPRYGTATVLCLIAPAVFLMSMVTDYAGFVAVRLVIGISLCMFVCCQFWVGTMFSVNIVGTANAFAGGWGNMGGGATLLLMPLFYSGIKSSGGMIGNEAWRWTFFIPAGAFIFLAIGVLMFTDDAPLGDYRDLKKNGVMAKGQGWKVFKVGVLNYRTWVMALSYGYCFGVELTIDNIIVQYLYDQFGLNLVTAGVLGSIFGLMNLFSRATGGMLSDVAAHYFGMRGRLWTLFILQTLGGVFCLLMAYVDYGLGPTIAIMVMFSIFCQQACGATYGIVPFISRRAYGVVAGCVGGGGNTGSAITQAVWFGAYWKYQLKSTWVTQSGFKWMGVMTICVTTILATVHFPQWGSMFLPGNPEVSEEDYYIKEWTAEEVAVGLHAGAMRFANESRSQRFGNASQRGLVMAKGGGSLTDPMGNSSKGIMMGNSNKGIKLAPSGDVDTHIPVGSEESPRGAIPRVSA